jgi:hypothetical protein
VRRRFEPSGEITSVDLIAALLELARERATASLDLARTGERIQFEFQEGDLAALRAPETHSPGQILIRSGKIQAETYRRLTVPEGEDRFSVAVASGVISKREALWAQKIAAIEALASVLTWTEGSYTLREDSPPAAGEFRLPVDRWILEFFLRSRDRPFVMERLGPTDAVLAPTERFADVFPSLGLTADADAVVGLVDGRATIQDVARKSSSEEFAIFKLLAALLSLELLAPEWSAGEAAFPPVHAPDPEIAFPEPKPEPPEAPAPVPEAAPASPSAVEEPAVEEPAVEEPAFEESDPEEPVAEYPALQQTAVPEVNLFAMTAPEEPPAGEAPDPDKKSRAPRVLLAAAFCAAAVAAAIAVWRARSPASAIPPLRVRQAPAGTLSPARPRETAAAKPSPSLRRESASEASPPTRTEEKASGGEDWNALAERGRRTFEHPGKFRYSIQLEIACETETLRRAAAQDRGGKHLWIVPTSYRGRSCYRVLWGRFTGLEEARRAKAGVPAIFSTGGNRPAVVPFHDLIH